MTARHARVEQFVPFPLDGVVVDERAVIACGCTIFISHVGVDGGVDRQLVLRACCEPHHRIVKRARELVLEAEPDDELLIAVVAESLSRASHELRPAIVEEV